MTLGAASSEEELRQCVVQVRSRDDPTTTDRVPLNEDEVERVHFFIDEELPAGDYALLQLAALGTAYSPE